MNGKLMATADNTHTPNIIIIIFEKEMMEGIEKKPCHDKVLVHTEKLNFCIV